MLVKMIAIAAVVVVLCAESSLSLASVRCVQRASPDFRADARDCGAFYMCSMGRLISFRCPQGSVFEDQTHSCVPAYSSYDKCSSRAASNQRCPPGSSERVAHPTQCSQYYDCGASHAHNERGWESQLRECPYPLVFSPGQGGCVQPSPGVCGDRQEPLDQCDYKANQCHGHSRCVPCHVRFPTCRGRQNGANAWHGRQGSPYYVTCHEQRVISTGMCEQRGAVFLFDEELKKCVKKEEAQKPEVSNLPGIHAPEPERHHQSIVSNNHGEDSLQQNTLQGNTYHQQTAHPQGYRPLYQALLPGRNQNRYQGSRIDVIHHQNQNGYQPNHIDANRNQNNQYEHVRL